MISICSRLYSPDGPVIIKSRTAVDSDPLTRRVSRQPTLDASAYIYDGGYSDSDRTPLVVVPPGQSTKALHDSLIELIKIAGGVTVSLEDGVFSGVIASLSMPAGQINLSILLEAKVSA